MFVAHKHFPRRSVKNLLVGLLVPCNTISERSNTMTLHQPPPESLILLLNVSAKGNSGVVGHIREHASIKGQLPASFPRPPKSSQTLPNANDYEDVGLLTMHP